MSVYGSLVLVGAEIREAVAGPMQLESLRSLVSSRSDPSRARESRTKDEMMLLLGRLCCADLGVNDPGWFVCRAWVGVNL
jgi:hypothetical protein